MRRILEEKGNARTVGDTFCIDRQRIGQELQKCRFSSTRGSQNGRYATLGEPQIHAVENGFPLGSCDGIDSGESAIGSICFLVIREGGSQIEGWQQSLLRGFIMV